MKINTTVTITVTSWWARCHLKSRLDCVLNYLIDCLLNRLFRRWSKKTSKLLVTGLCKGNPPVTSGFPSQRASNTENVSIWWRHHECIIWLRSNKIARNVPMLMMTFGHSHWWRHRTDREVKWKVITWRKNGDHCLDLHCINTSRENNHAIGCTSIVFE